MFEFLIVFGDGFDDLLPAAGDDCGGIAVEELAVGFLSETAAFVGGVPKRDGFRGKVVCIAWTEQKTDGVGAFADDFGETAVVGPDGGLAVSGSLEDGHWEAFIASGGHDYEPCVPVEVLKIFSGTVTE